MFETKIIFWNENLISTFFVNIKGTASLLIKKLPVEQKTFAGSDVISGNQSLWNLIP